MSYTQHPLSAAWPSMPENDFSDLCADMKANGQRVPIVIYEGMVLDGWHRYRACVAAGIEPMTEPFPEGHDPRAFVKSLNGHRRHQTASQRALAFAEVDRFAWAPPGRPTNPAAAAGFPATTAQRAKEADVSPRTLQMAETVVANAAPVVKEAVRSGAVSVETGARIAKLPKSMQGSALEEKRAPKPKSRKEQPPRTQEQIEHEQLLRDAYGDVDLVTLLEERQKEVEKLQAIVTVAEADDLKAEAMKWRRIYEVSERRQHELQRAVVEREATLRRYMGWLTRIGKSVGEDDPSKIPAAVVQLVESHAGSVTLERS